MLQVMARNWWVLALRGVLAVIFGIIVFLQSAIALSALILLFGVYALGDGIIAIINAIQHRASNPNWWVILIEGIVGVVAGILTFVYPGITAFVLLYIISAWAVITGIFEVMAAVQLRKEIDNEIWLGLSGLASIVFGVLLFLFPGAGILTVLWLVGVYAVVFGVVMIILALRLRGMGGAMGNGQGTQAAA